MKKSKAIRLHPVSTALLVLYAVIFLVQFNAEVLFAGLLAASAAYILELLFCATGAIRTSPSRAEQSVSAGTKGIRINEPGSVRASEARSSRKKEVLNIKDKTIRISRRNRLQTGRKTAA